MDMLTTSFADRVARRLSPNRAERAFLTSLETNLAQVEAGQLIAREGDPAQHAFVLRSGWAISYTRFPDGSHQVRRLHFPGDLLAMPSLPMRHYVEDLEALTDCAITAFPKTALAEIFQMPRLAALMYMFAQRERVTLGDRLASLGRDRAKARIAFLLIDILHRLRSNEPGVGCTFEMHLTREQIAHVTGMTSVHASRTWSELLEEGLISATGNVVTIHDEGRLAELAHYSDRDTDFDDEWLRAVSQV